MLSRVVLEPVVAARTTRLTRTFELDVTTMFTLLRTPSFAAPGIIPSFADVFLLPLLHRDRLGLFVVLSTLA